MDSGYTKGEIWATMVIVRGLSATGLRGDSLRKTELPTGIEEPKRGVSSLI